MTSKKKNLLELGLCGNANEQDVGDLQRFGIFLNSRQNFYDTIKGKQFKESLGVYYQEELDFVSMQKNNQQDGGQATETTGTPDTNKTKKRVITYQEI